MVDHKNYLLFKTRYKVTNDECWLCRIAWFCKCQSHFRLSLILFCLLPLVSSDGENKSAEERAKLVISINLLSRSHLEVKQQFSNSIYRKVTAQVRKQAILTDSPLQFSISGRWDFHHATPVCSGLDRNASSRQQKRYHVGCMTISSRKQMVIF